ncbi:sterol carrier protein [Haloechinothrix salitolerans]|uniref:Sterol carrier protein n=1 Tax=Haloechinothrix salitolerans TaxID=926830 RepID=A0ABW2BT73_9PSEU
MPLPRDLYVRIYVSVRVTDDVTSDTLVVCHVQAHHITVEVTMSLSCPEEVYRYIGGTFESAFDDPELGPKLRRAHLRMRFGLVDPDCVIHIDSDRSEVRNGTGADVDPSLIVAMDAETANRCCQGRLDFPSAMARGEVAARGDINGWLELVSRNSEFARMYVETLRREGRADLIVA